jgi:hypothetical protein
MKLSRIAATVAVAAIVSGCGVTHHGATAVTQTTQTTQATQAARATHAAQTPAAAVATSTATPHLTVAAPPAVTPATPATPHLTVAAPPAVTPAVAWLASAGGQAQVTFNNDVSTLAAALEVENYSPTVANHLVFEADARIVRAQARTILAAPALLPTVNRAGYKVMLNDFITVANLLQPGPGYGTTSQDYSAWYTAVAASNIAVS